MYVRSISLNKSYKMINIVEESAKIHTKGAEMHFIISAIKPNPKRTIPALDISGTSSFLWNFSKVCTSKIKPRRNWHTQSGKFTKLCNANMETYNSHSLQLGTF